MRTLVLAERLPFPPFGGGDLRTWATLRALGGLGSVGLFAVHGHALTSDPPPGVAGLDFWRVSAERADPGWTEDKRESRRWLLREDGLPSDRNFSPAIAAELAALVADYRPEQVVVEGLFLHRYLAVLDGTPVILDAHNVETDLARALVESGDVRGRFRQLLPARVAAVERRAAERVERVWVCSARDAALFRSQVYDGTPVDVVPNVVAPADYEGSEERAADLVLCPASWSYPPNQVSARWLLEEIWPAVRAEAPGLRLCLAGSGPTPWMRERAAEDPSVEVTGAREDLRPLFRAATLLIVPLRHGGGTRLKILEAFAARCPVLSTAKGIEGIEATPGVDFLQADDAPALAAAVLTLARDPARQAALAARGRALVEARYSVAALGARLPACLPGAEA